LHGGYWKTWRNRGPGKRRHIRENGVNCIERTRGKFQKNPEGRHTRSRRKTGKWSIQMEPGRKKGGTDGTTQIEQQAALETAWKQV